MSLMEFLKTLNDFTMVCITFPGTSLSSLQVDLHVALKCIAWVSTGAWKEGKTNNKEKTNKKTKNVQKQCKHAWFVVFFK